MGEAVENHAEGLLIRARMWRKEPNREIFSPVPDASILLRIAPPKIEPLYVTSFPHQGLDTVHPLLSELLDMPVDVYLSGLHSLSQQIVQCQIGPCSTDSSTTAKKSIQNRKLFT